MRSDHCTLRTTHQLCDRSLFTLLTHVFLFHIWNEFSSARSTYIYRWSFDCHQNSWLYWCDRTSFSHRKSEITSEYNIDFWEDIQFNTFFVLHALSSTLQEFRQTTLRISDKSSQLERHFSDWIQSIRVSKVDSSIVSCTEHFSQYFALVCMWSLKSRSLVCWNIRLVFKSN